MSEEIKAKIEERYPNPDRTTYVPMITALRQAAEFGYQLAQEEPNQDELWEEVEKEFKYPKTVFRTSDLTTITSAKENLKKRYRITRI